MSVDRSVMPPTAAPGAIVGGMVTTVRQADVEPAAPALFRTIVAADWRVALVRERSGVVVNEVVAQLRAAERSLCLRRVR